MNVRIIYRALFFSTIVLFFSCGNLFTDSNPESTPKNNFELLWTIIDENYCYFNYKDIDWDYQYNVYSNKIDDTMTEEELFDVFADMLGELKDGHVNLYSDFDITRYWNWYLDYPPNFDENIVERYYLGNDYDKAGGLSVKLLRDNIGYIRYGDFSSLVDDDNLDHVIEQFQNTDGIIIDIRNNGGGYVYISDLIASRFSGGSQLVGYTRYKIGPGHDDFSDYYPLELYDIDTSRQYYSKKVVVLTNRLVFSSANDFASKMSHLKNVTIMGDTTGGGGGVPISSELYNGWTVRYSANPEYDAKKNHIEFGIAPDIYIQMDTIAMRKNIDSMIEEAIDHLKGN